MSQISRFPSRSKELGISQTTFWRILHKDLGLHHYRIKLPQELKPLDHLKRRNFCDWALQKFEDNQFHRKIIFSDEAPFWLNGFLNKPSCALRYSIASTKSNRVVWISCWGVIGSYFFVDENDHHVTVNGNRYRAMLEDYFWSALDRLDISDMWLKQDGATSHTAGQKIIY